MRVLTLAFLGLALQQPTAQNAFTTLSLLSGRAGGTGNLDGEGTAARFSDLSALAYDGKGSLYAVDSEHSASHNGRIRRIDLTTGQVTTLPLGSGPADDRLESATSMVLDGAGSAIVAGYSGDLWRIVLATGEVSPVPQTPVDRGDMNGIGTAEGLALDGAGNLFVADGRNHTIRKIVLATGRTSVLAGVPHKEASIDGRRGVGRFGAPTDLIYDGAGHLYVSDWGVAGIDGTIRKVDLATGALTTIAKTPKARRIASDGSNLYFTNWDQHVVGKVELATGLVTNLVGKTDVAGGVDGPSGAARFNSPEGLAYDGRGNLYVIDGSPGGSPGGSSGGSPGGSPGADRVRQIALATGTVRTFAGDASRAAPIIDAAPGLPSALASDGNGNVFAAYSDAVRRIAPATGVASVVPGSPGAFETPTSLAYDGDGHLYAAVSGNGPELLRRLTLATGVVDSVKGAPTRQPAREPPHRGGGVGMTLPDLGLLAADGAGHLFVGHRGRCEIQEIALGAGTTRTVSGAPCLKLRDDARRSIGRGSVGAMTYGDDSLFVAVLENGPENPKPGSSYSLACVIDRISIRTGAVTKLATVPPADSGNCSISSLLYDGAGTLYAADPGNSVVDRIAVATGTVTAVVGVPGEVGLRVGTLPSARLSRPTALGLGPGPTLLIVDQAEQAILELR